MGDRDNEALNYFFFKPKNEKLLKQWKKRGGGGQNLVFAAFPASLHLGRQFRHQEDTEKFYLCSAFTMYHFKRLSDLQNEKSSLLNRVTVTIYFSVLLSTFFDLLGVLLFEVRFWYLLETPTQCEVSKLSLFQSPGVGKKIKGISKCVNLGRRIA